MGTTFDLLNILGLFKIKWLPVEVSFSYMNYCKSTPFLFVFVLFHREFNRKSLNVPCTFHIPSLRKIITKSFK